MIFRSAVFACAVAAMLAGCQQDRNERSQGYGRVIESTEPVEPAADTAAGSRSTASPAPQTGEAGHTATGTAPATGADVQARADAGMAPTSETATGVGTTTETGINTENQGTGNTDDPYR